MYVERGDGHSDVTHALRDNRPISEINVCRCANFGEGEASLCNLTARVILQFNKTNVPGNSIVFVDNRQNATLPHLIMTDCHLR